MAVPGAVPGGDPGQSEMGGWPGEPGRLYSGQGEDGQDACNKE